MANHLFGLCHDEVYPEAARRVRLACPNTNPAFMRRRFPGTDCFVDQATNSVRERGVRPEDVVIISPYKANVAQIERMRNGSYYDDFARIPPAETADSFQGREASIMVGDLDVLGSRQQRETRWSDRKIQFVDKDGKARFTSSFFLFNVVRTLWPTQTISGPWNAPIKG
ncbi:hypothetical protein CDD83_6603 [Cordyceps sp. RAO-2017]|nr:hypothetical protein CDD83_6603 [Cordyceps sp. RAO-2017]